MTSSSAAPIAARRRPVQPEPAVDVLDVDHRVVDELADGDGEAAERHGVDRQPEELEDDER